MSYLDDFAITLDETGFVFLDLNDRPYLIRQWGGGLWLFYWHKEGHWVSLREVSLTEIPAMFQRRLPPEQAELYHKLQKQWEEKNPPTPQIN